MTSLSQARCGIVGVAATSSIQKMLPSGRDRPRAALAATEGLQATNTGEPTNDAL